MFDFKETIGRLIDIALPEVCHFCGSRICDSDIDCICRKCAAKIPFRSKTKRNLKCLEENLLIRNGFPLSINLTVTAACYYEDPIRHALLNMKFHDESFHYKEFSSILAHVIRDEKILFDFIIPIPLHKSREKERGYNQTVLVAKSLAEETGSAVLEDLILRSRQTPRQSEAGSKDGRMMNVKEAFTCKNPERIKGKRLILLDDVLTSGATMFSAVQCIRGENLSVMTNSGSDDNVFQIRGLVIASDR